MTKAAKEFGQKSNNELRKLVELTKTGQALRDRGFNVIVHGEGVGGAAGELQLTLKGVGENLLAESKNWN